MNKVAKREAALKLLEATGIWKSNYAPSGLLLLWRLGFDCPPPHLARFWSVFLIYALYFGLSMGLLMLALSAFSDILSFTPLDAGVAGLFFGLFMAIYYAIGRRKYQLPLWKDLKVTAEA
jgi:polyferredoxin